MKSLAQSIYWMVSLSPLTNIPIIFLTLYEAETRRYGFNKLLG
jgi:hypothetical protein